MCAQRKLYETSLIILSHNAWLPCLLALQSFLPIYEKLNQKRLGRDDAASSLDDRALRF